MKNSKLLFLTQAALIAAAYVVLTVVFAPLGFGNVQVRFAEAMTILPYFTPAAIPGLFVGCLVGNVLGGAVVPDVIFGSLATLAGAGGTYLLRKKSIYLAPIPPIAANTIVVPFVLKYAYGMELPIPLMMLTVGAGELLSAGVMGVILGKILERNRREIFRT